MSFAKLKSRLFKKNLERRKSWAQTCLSVGCLHISEKKSLKIFDPNFTDIWRA